jgi:Protein of unknown function (DUF2852)
MSAMVERLDDLGRPAWIALMVLAFIVFWPLGLAVLGYLIWSGRMGCGRHANGRPGDFNRWQQRMAEKFERKAERWGMQARAYPATGNAAFDEYRAETLRRLEAEANEFRDYLEQLRRAKDKAEFDQFMTERRNRPSSGSTSEPPPAA